MISFSLLQDDEAEKGGEQDYLSALHEWADSEEDIKSQLKNIAQSQAKSEQAINDITVGLEEVKQVVDGLKETRKRQLQFFRNFQIGIQRRHRLSLATISSRYP